MIPKVHIGKALPATQVWTCRVSQRSSGCQGTTRPRPTVKTSLRSKQIHSPELMQKARRKAYFTGLQKYSIFYLDSHTRFTRIILQKPWILSFSATVKWQNLSQRRAFSWDTFCRGDSVLPPPTYSLFQINSSEHFCAGQNGIKSISLSQMALENTFFSTISLSPT